MSQMGPMLDGIRMHGRRPHPSYLSYLSYPSAKVE